MQKAVQTRSFCYSITKSVYKFCRHFSKLKKQNRKISILLIFLSLSFSFLHHTTQKVYNACKYYKYQMTAQLLEILLFWSGVPFELQLVSYNHEAVPHAACKTFSFQHFFGFSSRIPGVTSIVMQATAGLQNVSVTTS